MAPVTVANGGTGTTTAFTQGSVVFAGASGNYSQDNANFFWDDTNNRLGVGTTIPSTALQVVGTARASGFSSADGTAGSPAYYFNSDANTGMYSGGADTLAFSTGGTSRMNIDSAGKVNVAGDLDVSGALKGVTNTYGETDTAVNNTSNSAYVTSASASVGPGDFLVWASVEAYCNGCYCQTRLRNTTDVTTIGGDVYTYDGGSAMYAPASWVKRSRTPPRNHLHSTRSKPDQPALAPRGMPGSSRSGSVHEVGSELHVRRHRVLLPAG